MDSTATGDDRMVLLRLSISDLVVVSHALGRYAEDLRTGNAPGCFETEDEVNEVLKRIKARGGGE